MYDKIFIRMKKRVNLKMKYCETKWELQVACIETINNAVNKHSSNVNKHSLTNKLQACNLFQSKCSVKTVSRMNSGVTGFEIGSKDHQVQKFTNYHKPPNNPDYSTAFSNFAPRMFRGRKICPKKLSLNSSKTRFKIRPKWRTLSLSKLTPY